MENLYLYDQGNASPAIRAEIMEQLELFQEGYVEAADLVSSDCCF